MILITPTTRMSFTLKETNQLYKNIISNGMIPKTQKEKELLKVLKIKYKKEKKKSIKKGTKVLVYFELDKEECIEMGLSFSEDKMSESGTVTHFINGRVKRVINKKEIKVYFPIDKTSQIVPIDTIKLI